MPAATGIFILGHLLSTNPGRRSFQPSPAIAGIRCVRRAEFRVLQKLEASRMNKILALLCAMLFAISIPALAADKDAKAAPKAAATKADDKIDINRAKADELMKLDGIGD